MRKNIIFYAIAVLLLVMSVLSFHRAYQEMQRYSLLTNRSVVVFGAYQQLARQVTNAAISNPDLAKAQRSNKMSELFFADSIGIVKQLRELNTAVLDSINIKIAKQLSFYLNSELSWLLTSNVPDSIIHGRASGHLTALKHIDYLIREGVARTNFLFHFRSQQLEASITQVKYKVVIFLGLACILLIYTTVNLFRQQSKRLEKEFELKKQEKKFRAMVENSQDLTVIIDEKLNVLYRSPSAFRITGFTTEERLENTSLDEVHEDDREKIKSYISEMKASPGKVIAATYRLKHKKGHYIWLEGSFTSMLHDPDLKGIVINVRDVSLQKYTEGNLTQSERRFRQTLENMLEGVQIIGFDWRYIYVNEALTKYSTYKSGAMIGSTVMEIYPGVEQTELYVVLKTCMEERVARQLESEFVFPDGTKKFFELSVQPVPEGVFILSVDITERRKAAEELKKSIKELSDFKYAINESAIVAITDQKGVIQHVNDNFCTISKYKREDLIGKDHRIINSGFHSKEFIRKLWTTIANGQIWKGEIKNIASDGSIYWVDTTIVPFLDEKHKPYQYLAIRYDITERKMAEEEIIKLNRLYAFISAINQSIVHINSEEILLQKACDIAIETGGFKFARIDLLDQNNKLRTVSVNGDNWIVEEVKNQTAIDYTAPVIRDTPLGKALLTGSYAVNNDVRKDPALQTLTGLMERIGGRSAIALPITKSGKMIGVFNLTSSQVGFFDSREIELLLEAAGDISFALDIFEKARQHRVTEEQVIHNEKRFRALIEKSTDMKTLTGSDGTFVYASPSVSKVFGYSEEEFLNKPASEFFHPEDVPDLLKKRADILNKPGASFNFQYRVLHKEGHWIWCEGTLTNMFHEPPINALVSNFKDISEKKRAEQQHEFDRNNLNALINNTNDLLWSLDRDFRFITFNQPFFEAVKAIAGIEIRKGESVFSAALSMEHEERFRAFYSRAFAGEIFTITDVIEGTAGYATEISFYPIRQGNEIIGTACHSRDITLRIKQEQEREKMLTDLIRYSKNLEQFAYVVSHNLRSPVAHILGLGNLLNSDISDHDKKSGQELMFKAVNQLDVIVKDLNKILDVRAAVGLNKESIDLVEIVQGIKDSIFETIKNEKVTITLDFEMRHLLSVKTYIYSIFYNLITNSIKYKKQGIDPFISISAHQGNDLIKIVFRDNGMGMKLNEYGNKVFGLYQRFHLNVGGKGMGLFMVKKQVEALEGTISLKSVWGEGTEFTIELPIENKG